MSKNISFEPVKRPADAPLNADGADVIDLASYGGLGRLMSMEEFFHSVWFRENADLTAEEVHESHFWHDYYCALITDINVSDLDDRDNRLHYLKEFLDSDYAFFDFVIDAIKVYGRVPDEETIDEFANSNTIQCKFNSMLEEIDGQIREDLRLRSNQ